MLDCDDKDVFDWNDNIENKELRSDVERFDATCGMH